MGQDDILKLLKKEKRWLSCKQIKEILGNSSAHRSLNVLLKSNEVLRKEVKVNNHHEFQWRIK